MARNNQKINYPLQRVLVALQAKEEFDFDDVVTWFCISWLTMYTCHNPLQQLVNCWNFHRIPGHECVTLENMLQSNRAVKIPKELVPTPGEVWECIRRGVAISHAIHIVESILLH